MAITITAIIRTAIISDSMTPPTMAIILPGYVGRLYDLLETSGGAVITPTQGHRAEFYNEQVHFGFCKFSMILCIQPGYYTV